MKIRSMELRNYRNYEALSLSLDEDINVFLGQNAQGKTNVLEAVYYSALARSHRTSVDGELIRWEEPKGFLSLVFERIGVENTLEFHFERGKRRRIMYNGQPIRTKELIGAINVVLFSPEDLFLIKGAPAGRRRFLDMEISQADPAYFHDLAVYTRVITQRNTLLKRIREHQAQRSMLDLWDEQLAPLAARIVKKRQKAVGLLNEIADRMQRKISGEREELSLVYELHGMEEGAVTEELSSWYNQSLREFQEKDIMRGATGVGPHRDDLAFFVNGMDLRSYGSQGQQRTGALALKLSELAFFKEETGEYPVLLLDDVMSELDRGRREKLLDFIREEHIQTLITATDEAYFPEKEFGHIYHVKAGTVEAG